MSRPLYHGLTAAELAPSKGRRSKDGRPRARRAHEQTGLEALARDYNWKRGRIIAFEKNAQALVHSVAPESDALITTVARMTAALLRWAEVHYDHSRALHLSLPRIATRADVARNFDQSSRS